MINGWQKRRPSSRINSVGSFHVACPDYLILRRTDVSEWETIAKKSKIKKKKIKNKKNWMMAAHHLLQINHGQRRFVAPKQKNKRVADERETFCDISYILVCVQVHYMKPGPALEISLPTSHCIATPGLSLRLRRDLNSVIPRNDNNKLYFL
ncbi:hypothetical protein AA313_de0204528 [Arthrobotrys entomopaga]|nr:hypothetical protein AA313_de0204528 [Arthrobotrys entomopaga]